ncbi:MAG: hypothetical protein GF350_05270, partial [Chitinivibrionales bacterium]|nr:hypothetical protein [Chitinivibrionales bacterium]
MYDKFPEGRIVRSRMVRGGPFFFMILLPLALSCTSSAPMPGNMAEQFSRWFIAPSEEKLDSLLSVSFTLAQLDSIISTAKNTLPRTGAATAILTDRSNQSWTLGYYAPPEATVDTLYPLVIYLHGGIGTTRRDKGKTAYEMLSALCDSITVFLASPSGNRFGPWWSADGLSRILQSVRYMTLHFPVNPDKIFLAGVSDGATGCYAAANTICGPFAGFIPVSGYGGLLTKLGIPLIPQNIMQRPIYNIYA